MIGIGGFIWRIGSGAALSFAVALVSVAGAWAQSAPPSSESVLAAAFENRYAIDAISRVELVMRGGSDEEIRRKVHYITKIIDQRLHSIARLTAPEYLRGMTILTIEQRDRSHDAFAFIPSLGKTRRVTTAQKGDAFFGSDLTYEDLERKRTDEFELGELALAESEGEAIYRIGVAPVHKGIYSRVEFDVAQLDHAILATRYYKSGESEPYRVLESPRSSMVERGGHVLPSRLLVRDVNRGTSTEVLISDLEVDASIPDRIFTVSTLEQKRKLPEPKP
ncbi:MAG: outer membrane lipoprotein-sorting protein [Deltaproteobacteria bacterium]|nr:outer membrane lipoprotein-sorting protein [Deltaproteobacteria bacterium]MBW2542069.1 outer membrane lipoprotein-sorting protein [Deltaproteobacteria bacterium]